MEHSRASSIAIIGASVRGTSILERLLASASSLHPDPLVVHVIDPYAHGSGRIWRADQPQTLIMNTVAAQSTLFTDDTTRIEGPRHPGPSLAEWCREVVADPTIAGPALPPEVLAEAARTLPHSSPSRLLYGYYLRWCHDSIRRSAPAHVEVREHRARAIDLRRDGDGWQVVLEGHAPVHADAVVLAVGWLERDDIAVHTKTVAPGNPVDQDLSAVRPGEVVAVRGLGMGFFDTFSQLTEQRGGRFIEQPDGSLRYAASGREPHILAGSRRGMPYRAKPDFGAPPFFPEQRILRAAIPLLRARRPVDFRVDVLPLIERDAAFDYYRALARRHPLRVRDVDSLLAALRDTDEDVAAVIARHVPDPRDRLSLPDAIDPLRALAAPTDADVAAEVRADIDAAAQGADSPFKLALHSYAAARSAVIPLVEFGGLTEASFPAYRTFLADAAAFSSGPPLRRARQLLAAHEAGIVRFTGRGMAVTAGDEHFTVRADGAAATRADHLVEAWLPAPTVERTGDPLLRSLVTHGFARPWRFPSGIPSDALDVDQRNGAVIAADGTPARDLFSVGVPHEDIRVFTIIAPVPGTDSSVLRETDATARAALRAAHAVTSVASRAPLLTTTPEGP